MKVTGIIAEYDPLHNGHAYHIKAVKDAGADAVIVILGGNFTQRGEVAFCDKAIRARASLMAGADLVIELPLPFAMASAERFAKGGVALLNALGNVNFLSFGCGVGNASSIMELSRILESDEFASILKEELKSGVGYALARANTAKKLSPAVGSLLDDPNALLGSEYCKWLLRLNSPLTPQTVRRVGAGHNESPNGGYASASFLRTLKDVNALSPYVPESVFPLYREANDRGELFCHIKYMERGILAKLRTLSVEDYAKVPDALAEGLYNRVYNTVGECGSIDELYEKIKTRRYALSRVRRVIMGAFLGLDESVLKNAFPPYIHVLAMNEVGERVIKEASKTCPLPISSSLSVLRNASPICEYFAELESFGEDMFWLFAPTPRPKGEAYRRKLIKL